MFPKGCRHQMHSLHLSLRDGPNPPFVLGENDYQANFVQVPDNWGELYATSPLPPGTEPTALDMHLRRAGLELLL